MPRLPLPALVGTLETPALTRRPQPRTPRRLRADATRTAGARSAALTRYQARRAKSMIGAA